jgi:hypothetical protein
LVNDALNEFTYFATMAKMNYSLQAEQDGMSVRCPDSVLVFAYL